MPAAVYRGGMDAETRQSLGGAIVGAVLVAVGLVLVLLDADVVSQVAAVFAWGGGILLVVLALRTAALLMRRETPS